MPLSKEVQELFDLVTKPEFLEPTPRPPNKLFEQLAEIKGQYKTPLNTFKQTGKTLLEELCTGLSGILGNYEDLAQSSVLKQPDEPGTSTISVGVELAPLLTTVKQQCDELLEIGMPKDNVAVCLFMFYTSVGGI